MGTAALRGVQKTEDGKAFLRDASKALGYTINVISGKMEAVLTAWGVLRENPDIDARVVSIGGGSIESADVQNGKISNAFAINAGALTLKKERRISGARPITNLRHKLEKAYKVEKVLYIATGGAFRAIGTAFSKGEVLSFKKVRAALLTFSTTPQKKLVDLSAKIAERAPQIQEVARALRTIGNIGGAKRMFFSKANICDGALYGFETRQDMTALISRPLDEQRPFYGRRLELVRPVSTQALYSRTTRGAIPA